MTESAGWETALTEKACFSIHAVDQGVFAEPGKAGICDLFEELRS